MIPQAYIQAWRKHAPWPNPAQVEPLLPVGVRFDQAVAIEAFNDVWSTLIARLRGDAWKLTAEVVAQLRATYPRLLT